MNQPELTPTNPDQPDEITLTGQELGPSIRAVQARGATWQWIKPIGATYHVKLYWPDRPKDK